MSECVSWQVSRLISSLFSRLFSKWRARVVVVVVVVLLSSLVKDQDDEGSKYTLWYSIPWLPAHSGLWNRVYSISLIRMQLLHRFFLLAFRLYVVCNYLKKNRLRRYYPLCHVLYRLFFFKIHRVFDKIKEEEKKATYFTVGWCSSAAGDTAKKRARVCEAKKSVTCRPVDAVLPRRASASSESRSAISLEGITQSSSSSLLTSRHERQEEYLKKALYVRL